MFVGQNNRFEQDEAHTVENYYFFFTRHTCTNSMAGNNQRQFMCLAVISNNMSYAAIFPPAIWPSSRILYAFARVDSALRSHSIGHGGSQYIRLFTFRRLSIAEPSVKPLSHTHSRIRMNFRAPRMREICEFFHLLFLIFSSCTRIY